MRVLSREECPLYTDAFCCAGLHVLVKLTIMLSRIPACWELSPGSIETLVTEADDQFLLVTSDKEYNSYCPWRESFSCIEYGVHIIVWLTLSTDNANN